MGKLDKILTQMETRPKSVRFSDLVKICCHYFGEPRQRRTSHLVYRTPWPGDPRVNIQEGKNGKAKVYQVKQVLEAIKKLEEQDDNRP